MANKLYEEEHIRAIAEEIRLRSDRKRTYKVSEMAQGVTSACQDTYERGMYSGFEAGIEYVKTEEARTEADITTECDVPQNLMYVTVPQGYYAKTEEMSINADPFYDDGLEEGYSMGYDDGYCDGYDDGYDVGFEAGSAGGVADPTTVWELPETINFSNQVPNVTVSFNSAGIDFIGLQGLGTTVKYTQSDGTGLTVRNINGWVNEAYRTITILEEITDETFLAWLEANATLISSGSGGGGDNNAELEEMLISSDENYDDEGKEFYNVHKWLDISHTGLSSAPVTITVMNNHPTLWMHVYFKIIGDRTGNPYYRTMAIEFDQGENSIEFDQEPILKYVLEGVRWSKNGI